MDLPLNYETSDVETGVTVSAVSPQHPALARVTDQAVQEIEEFTSVSLSLNDRKIVKDIASEQLSSASDNNVFAMFETVRRYCNTYLGGMRNPAFESRSHYRNRIRKAMARFECGRRP